MTDYIPTVPTKESPYVNTKTTQKQKPNDKNDVQRLGEREGAFLFDVQQTKKTIEQPRPSKGNN